MREALIEIARQESNQRWMDPGIGVEPGHGPEPVAMPNRRGRRDRRWRGVGAADRLEARVPKAAHGPPLLAHAIILVDENGRCGPGVRRHVGPKPRQRRCFFQDPRELSTCCGRNAVQHDGPPEIEAGADAGHISGASGPQLFIKERRHVLRENPA